jgi:hypothetical protein
LDVISFEVKFPLASLVTIVEAPFDALAVVRALAKVPEAMLEALIAVSAIPLPEIDTDVIAPALNSPEVPRSTIVEAPFAVAAVVRAFATVPDDRFEALIAVKATPFPEIDTEVIAPALNSPEAPRATIVDAPLADAAVVLALATVPVVTFEPLIALIAEPLAVMMFAVKLPLAFLETIVLAPLASEAVVLALATVPVDTFEPLIAEIEAPPPMKFVAVTALAVKFPEASRATIVLAPLAEAAVVAELGMLVKDAPDPLNVVAVITLPANDPAALRETIVLAPLASEAVVLAFAMVPDEMFEALIPVKPPPAPLIVVNVPT